MKIKWNWNVSSIKCECFIAKAKRDIQSRLEYIDCITCKEEANYFFEHFLVFEKYIIWDYKKRREQRAFYDRRWDFCVSYRLKGQPTMSDKRDIMCINGTSFVRHINVEIVPYTNTFSIVSNLNSRRINFLTFNTVLDYIISKEKQLSPYVQYCCRKNRLKREQLVYFLHNTAINSLRLFSFDTVTCTSYERVKLKKYYNFLTHLRRKYSRTLKNGK